MPRPSSLSAYPGTTLQAVRTAVTTLLKYRDILPTDLSTKLDLFHGDINAALGRVPGPAPIFVPHAIPLRPAPGQGQQSPRHPSAPRDNPPPERHPR